MFNLEDQKYIKLLDLNAQIYTESEFKCKHIHLESNSDEKVFMVAFRTIPEDRGLSYNQNSDLIFDINFTTKDTVESDRMNHYYSRYYWDYYMYRDDLYTVTQNILRVNLKDLSQDKTVWTVVTVWRDGSSRSISYDDASNILVDEIMVSFL